MQQDPLRVQTDPVVLGLRSRELLIKRENGSFEKSEYLKNFEKELSDILTSAHNSERRLNLDDAKRKEMFESAAYLFLLSAFRVQRPMSHGALIINMSGLETVLGTKYEDYVYALSDPKDDFREEPIDVRRRVYTNHYEQMHSKQHFDGADAVLGLEAFASGQVFDVEPGTLRKVLKYWGMTDKGDATSTFDSKTHLGTKGYKAYLMSALLCCFANATSEEHHTAGLTYCGKLVAIARRGSPHQELPKYEIIKIGR